jgi:hypothetical protein
MRVRSRSLSLFPLPNDFLDPPRWIERISSGGANPTLIAPLRGVVQPRRNPVSHHAGMSLRPFLIVPLLVTRIFRPAHSVAHWLHERGAHATA